MGWFKKFAHSQFRSLTEHLENYRDKKETELLHKIRVDIKKIKALLLATNACVKGFRAHKNFIPFRTIFRRAGEIREPEILTRLLLEYGIPGVHDPKIDQGNEKLITSFCNDVPLFIGIVNEQWHTLKPVFNELSKKRIVHYLRKTRKKIKSKLYPKAEMNLIHKVRKSIKGFIYLSEDRQPNKKLVHFYAKEAVAIGELHDRQILLNLMAKENGTSDKALIKKIKAECVSKKGEIVKRALKFYEI